MSFEERGPFGNSDYPVTKPEKEWVPEAQSHDLSPEDQVALREFLKQYKQAKRKGDEHQMGMAASEIAELTGKKSDELDLNALIEEFGIDNKVEEATPKEKEASLKYQKNLEKLEDQEEITETTGRKKLLHGTELPVQVGSAPERNLPSKISRITEKDKRQMRRGEQQRKKNTDPQKPSGRRRTNEQKPMWRAKRSETRKTRMAQKRKAEKAA